MKREELINAFVLQWGQDGMYDETLKADVNKLINLILATQPQEQVTTTIMCMDCNKTIDKCDCIIYPVKEQKNVSTKEVKTFDEILKYGVEGYSFSKEGEKLPNGILRNKKGQFIKGTNGEKPKYYDIHHKDYDKRNYNLENLELLSGSDHRKIHAGWIRKNGEWILKPCKDCKQLLPISDFYQRKGMTPSNRCIKCSSKYWKEKLINDLEYRERKIKYSKEYNRKRRVING